MRQGILAFLRATAVPFIFLGLCIFQSWKLGEIHRQADAVIRKDLAERLKKVDRDLHFPMYPYRNEGYCSGDLDASGRLVDPTDSPRPGDGDEVLLKSNGIPVIIKLPAGTKFPVTLDLGSVTIR